MKNENDSPVRRARRAASLSQIELALMSRVSLSTIRLAERNIHSARTLRRISRALGLNIDALTGRQEAK